MFGSFMEPFNCVGHLTSFAKFHKIWPGRGFPAMCRNEQQNLHTFYFYIGNFSCVCVFLENLGTVPRMDSVL